MFEPVEHESHETTTHNRQLETWLYQHRIVVQYSIPRGVFRRVI